MKYCLPVLALLACTAAANASMLLVVTSDNVSPEFDCRVLGYDGNTGDFVDVFFHAPLADKRKVRCPSPRA